MSRDEILKKYLINASHSEWEPIDDWNLVEIFKIMENRLPSDNDTSWMYLIDFLDKFTMDTKWAVSLPSFGSLYTTAKRAIYRLCPAK